MSLQKIWHPFLLGALTLGVLVFGIYITFFVATRPYIFATTDTVPTTTVALVPGAALTASGKLSSVFQARVDGALALYEAKKVSKILVSGDNSTVGHNEVDPARIYLMDKGVSDADIFLDHAGFDTYSSMYRARTIFGVTSIVVVTQSFHLPRAVFIARALGIVATGFRTDIPHLSPVNYEREIFANVKAVVDLFDHRIPKFLGDTIPITGDGRNYR